jgi:lysophospholipase L1-like esterase
MRRGAVLLLVGAVAAVLAGAGFLGLRPARRMPVLPRAISRHRFILAVAVAGLAALPVMATVASAAAQSPVNYVALGDSYSSGVGAGDYYGSSGSCDRSPNAYPALWAAANDPASYVSVACSGATTGSVISSQLSALSPSTTLVSITIGGNDVGFTSVMETCVIFPTSACVSAIDTAEGEISADLPGDLNRVLSDIAADAPNARVVVLDYPQLYDLSRSSSCIGLTTTDRTDLNQAANQLDSQIQAAAERYNDVFADVRWQFAGHQICDSNGWLNSVDWFDLGESYHPTASGQSGGYGPVFSQYAS